MSLLKKASASVGWAAAEGANRAFLGAIAKFLGEFSKSLGGCALLVLAIGIFQVLFGITGVRLKSWSVKISLQRMMFAAAFAVGAIVNTILGVFVYTYEGADMGVSTFLRTTSIVFAALFSWGLLKQTPTWKTWTGIVLFLIAGWFLIGSPDLSEVQSTKTWMILSLVIAVFAAVNEMLMQRITALSRDKDKDVYTMQVWTGLFTAVGVLPVLFYVGGITQQSVTVWLLILVIAVGVVIQLCWRFFAYCEETLVVLKKFFTISVYLVFAVVFGVLIHGEELAAAKLVGIPLAILSYLFLDPKVFDWVKKQLKK